MKSFIAFAIVLIACLCDGAIYEIDQGEFSDFVDNTLFKVLSYDEVTELGYSIPVPPAGQDSLAFYLNGYVTSQYTNRYIEPSSGMVTFEATYYCDATISEFEVRFSYPWQDHYMVLCGPQSGSTPGVWQTRTRNFYCLSAQGCSQIEVWIYGITVSPDAIVGLQNLKIVTDGSTLPTTVPATGTTTQEPTTDAVQTTQPSGEGLACYSCVSCPHVQEDTNILQLPEYLTCVLSFFGSTIIRGGSPDVFHGGECTLHDGIMDCYCNTPLCNNQNVSVSENFRNFN